MRYLMKLLLLLKFLETLFAMEIPLMIKYYCVVGAGPAGLQMAYYFHKAQRDYVVFEKEDSSGSFFKRYPRHRKLNSINKRYTGRSNREFNLRHDWNSLISDDEHLLFSQYSENYYPEADEMVNYLNDYQTKLKLNVQFNTTVSNLQYNKDAKTEYCRFTMVDQNQNLYCCRNVFVGIGWQKSKIPEHLKGVDYLQTYENMSTDIRNYKAKNVLIIGGGNSGLETASSLYQSANYVHMISSSRIRHSWKTHYVGDARTAHNSILDSYSLQGPDNFFQVDIELLNFTKRPDGKIQVTIQKTENAKNSDQNFFRDGYDHIILCLGFQWSDTVFNNTMKVASADLPGLPKDAYPDIGNDYQAKQYFGLYFVGALSHSLDYRKSAGGFIHGFRYTERALHRLLEWRNHGIKWPSVTKSVDQIVSSLLKRASEGSGIYHMFEYLCDVAVYDSLIKQITYLEEVPVSLIPNLLTNTGYEFNPAKHSAFILTLQYGTSCAEEDLDYHQVFGQVDQAHLEARLHPVIYYYNGKLPTVAEMEHRQLREVLPNPEAVHHILEDSSSLYDDPNTQILPLRRFVEHFVNQDLRSFRPETCAGFALTTKAAEDKHKLPFACQNYSEKLDTVLTYC